MPVRESCWQTMLYLCLFSPCHSLAPMSSELSSVSIPNIYVSLTEDCPLNGIQHLTASLLPKLSHLQLKLHVPVEPFHYDDGPVFNGAPLHKLPWTAVLGSMGLGFCLSLLFFMDQNISGAMVNSPDNKLAFIPWSESMVCSLCLT